VGDERRRRTSGLTLKFVEPFADTMPMNSSASRILPFALAIIGFVALATGLALSFAAGQRLNEGTKSPSNFMASNGAGSYYLDADVAHVGGGLLSYGIDRSWRLRYDTRLSAGANATIVVTRSGSNEPELTEQIGNSQRGLLPDSAHYRNVPTDKSGRAEGLANLATLAPGECYHVGTFVSGDKTAAMVRTWCAK
jgi:hypothetical protein